MPEYIKLSALAGQIHEIIQDRFNNDFFWVSAQAMDINKNAIDRRCYLKLIEYENGAKITELRAVFWSDYYDEIERFEQQIKQPFSNGTEIICKVKVRLHKKYGLNIDVMQIDVAHTLGILKLERQKTLERLLRENSKTIQFFDGDYLTLNNRLPLPLVIKNIALITAPDSDGQRDFKQEIVKNKYQYFFAITEFLTTIQGDNAHLDILEQLKLIEKSKGSYDVVAIVRRGSSLTDFKPFNDYELARHVANFPIPIFTGIGHDNNQSIVDLMVREQKTSTRVATQFIDHNFEFEKNLIELRTNFYDIIKQKLQNARDNLNNANRIIKMANPQKILNRGFAIITCNDKIITDPKDITEKSELQTILKNETIHSIVTKKTRNEKRIGI